jgi:hypothetical protein
VKKGRDKIIEGYGRVIFTDKAQNYCGFLEDARRKIKWGAGGIKV